MLQYHHDSAANRLLNLIAQLPLSALRVMDVGALMVAWSRHGQSNDSFSQALNCLLSDRLLSLQPEGLRLQVSGYALITDELALPIREQLVVDDDAQRPPDAVLRERLLSLLLGGAGGPRKATELARAWETTGERIGLLRRALSLCESSGQVGRTRWGKRKYFATLAGRRWMDGRACPQSLLKFARDLQCEGLPPQVRDDELCNLALGAFKRPGVGATLSTAHMTHFLWRCGIPESVWFHAIETLHREGLISTTRKPNTLQLTQAGYDAIQRRQSIGQRAKLTRTLRQLREPAPDSQADGQHSA